MEAAVARYGQGNFRWVAMVGDLYAIYDEIDPALASVFRLPRGTRGIYHVGFGEYHTPTERSHLCHGL